MSWALFPKSIFRIKQALSHCNCLWVQFILVFKSSRHTFSYNTGLVLPWESSCELYLIHQGWTWRRWAASWRWRWGWCHCSARSPFPCGTCSWCPSPSHPRNAWSTGTYQSEDQAQDTNTGWRGLFKLRQITQNKIYFYMQSKMNWDKSGCNV